MVYGMACACPLEQTPPSTTAEPKEGIQIEQGPHVLASAKCGFQESLSEWLFSAGHSG